MSTAVAYIRTSDKEPLFGGDVQRAAIEKWAAKKQITVSVWFADDNLPDDAKLDQRPALQGAIEALGAHPWLLVARRDRLSTDALAAGLVEVIVTDRKAKLGVVFPTGSNRPR